MTPRHVLTSLVIVIGPTSPTQRLTRRCQSPQALDLPGRHVPPALPVSPVLTHLLVRSLVSLLAQGPSPVPRPHRSVALGDSSPGGKGGKGKDRKKTKKRKAKGGGKDSKGKGKKSKGKGKPDSTPG